MRYRYLGQEATYDRVLGLLTPGCEGDGPDDEVALKIAGGLLTAVPEGDTPPPNDEGRG
jgi:hypothetical protein